MAYNVGAYIVFALVLLAVVLLLKYKCKAKNKTSTNASYKKIKQLIKPKKASTDESGSDSEAMILFREIAGEQNEYIEKNKFKQSIVAECEEEEFLEEELQTQQINKEIAINQQERDLIDDILEDLMEVEKKFVERSEAAFAKEVEQGYNPKNYIQMEEEFDKYSNGPLDKSSAGVNMDKKYMDDDCSHISSYDEIEQDIEDKQYKANIDYQEQKQQYQKNNQQKQSYEEKDGIALRQS